MSAVLIQRPGWLEKAAATAIVATFVGSVGLSLLAFALFPIVGFHFHSHDVGLVTAALSGVVFKCGGKNRRGKARRARRRGRP